MQLGLEVGISRKDFNMTTEISECKYTVNSTTGGMNIHRVPKQMPTNNNQMAKL